MARLHLGTPTIRSGQANRWHGEPIRLASSSRLEPPACRWSGARASASAGLSEEGLEPLCDHTFLKHMQLPHWPAFAPEQSGTSPKKTFKIPPDRFGVVIGRLAAGYKCVCCTAVRNHMVLTTVISVTGHPSRRRRGTPSRRSADQTSPTIRPFGCLITIQTRSYRTEGRPRIFRIKDGWRHISHQRISVRSLPMRQLTKLSTAIPGPLIGFPPSRSK